MRNFSGFQRTVCDCELCVANCQFIPGYLLPDDLISIGLFIGYTDLSPFIEQNFLASPGALVSKAGQLLRIRTIVPAREEQGWCKFFDGKLCKIHPVAPFGCAFFDSHQELRHSERISALGLMFVAAQWQDEAHSLYCRIWHHLYRAGLTAPSPEECREWMAKSRSTTCASMS